MFWFWYPDRPGQQRTGGTEHERKGARESAMVQNNARAHRCSSRLTVGVAVWNLLSERGGLAFRPDRELVWGAGLGLERERGRTHVIEVSSQDGVGQPLKTTTTVIGTLIIN